MDWLSLAATAEEHMAKGRMFEVLGWSLGALAFVILGVGVFVSIKLDKRKKEKQARGQEENAPLP